MFQLQLDWAGDLAAKLVGMSCQAETPISAPTGDPRGCWNYQLPSGLV